MRSRTCSLALEDGTVFRGTGFGAEGTATGEVVFNTAMSGYQEILTDPSYCGQIVTMTAPLIGNYGVNAEDIESSGQYLSGFVVRELARRHSNQRATGALDDYMQSAGVIGLQGIDTRALTKRLRDAGALRGVLSTEILDPATLVAEARRVGAMNGQNLIDRVMQPAPGPGSPGKTGDGRPLVIALDCGLKRNIVRRLNAVGCSVQVLPGDTGAAAVLERRPDGVLVGNGPGDPAAVSATINSVRGIVGKVPIFGICLGHQILSLALGARTYKLKFGHHGANHPVLQLDTGRVEITSQNHGFAVEVDSLRTVGGRPTHVSLYDGSLEGFAHETLAAFAVQYHPEASPGPHDSHYLFERFVSVIGAGGALEEKMRSAAAT